jgi:2-oxoglutarate dehydrogenase E2 component (dihydrolipoamide succinyltransferase)
MTEIRVPTLGESVSEATIGKWFKQPGDAVAVDEPLVELETDKVTIEVPAPTAGTLSDIVAKDGETVAVGALLGNISPGSRGARPAQPVSLASAPAAVAKPAALAAAAVAPATAGQETATAAPVTKDASAEQPLAPSVRRLAAESGISPATVPATGKDGRVTKGDMLAAIERAAAAPIPVPATPVQMRAPSAPDDAAREERVRMTRLRQTIARRLKEAQNTAAMLTTFNEVDMSSVMALRTQYRDLFEKRHGVKLGFMGFFVKAAVHALKKYPAVNASIDGTDIVYHGYFDIGIAVGSPRGLVVPILRDADQMSLAEIEKQIAEYGKRASEGKLTVQELTGGTYTISNGGVFGSMLSTPIINPPQSAILGVHATKERAVVENGQVVVRPINYLAQSYDHRIIDGREAVLSLVAIKEALEDPARMLLDL